MYPLRKFWMSGPILKWQLTPNLFIASMPEINYISEHAVCPYFFCWDLEFVICAGFHCKLTIKSHYCGGCQCALQFLCISSQAISNNTAKSVVFLRVLFHSDFQWVHNGRTIILVHRCNFEIFAFRWLHRDIHFDGFCGDFMFVFYRQIYSEFCHPNNSLVESLSIVYIKNVFEDLTFVQSWKFCAQNSIGV